ncbi:MAG: hypothetical protein COA47_14340 [Robiginitomaculum sp.]|nr:MAG: hypothetical protein COA47_14340 [Robiginitomaculum sp.]
MSIFNDIEDVQDWLEPMDYLGFWHAVAPYDLILQDRDHCDTQIATGEVTQETVLCVLKGFARIELTQRLGLKRRPVTPWVQLVASH